MSLELLPTLEKEVANKKKTVSTKNDQSKKESPSLFDSLMKDVLEKKPNKKVLSSQIESNTKDSDNKKENKQVGNPEGKLTTISNTQEEKTTQVKKMVNNLVEIVVEKSKDNQKEIDKAKSIINKDLAKVSLENNEVKLSSKEKAVLETGELKTNPENTREKISVEKFSQNIDTIKDEIFHLKQEIHTTDKVNKNKTIEESDEKLPQQITKKTNVVKDVVKEIKSDLSQVVEESSVKKLVQKSETVESKITQTNLQILDKIDNNTIEKGSSVTSNLDVKKTKQTITIESSLKEENIKKTDSVVSSLSKQIETIESDIEEIETITLKAENQKSTTKVELLSDENLKTIDQKASNLLDTANKIEIEVKQVIFVSSEELVNKIEEFKKEYQETKSDKTVFITTDKTIVNNSKVDLSSESKKEVLSNSFLSEQQQLKQKISMQNLQDAKNNIEQKQTLSSIKESAESLALNPEEVEVDQVGKEGESKSELFTKNNKKVQEQVFQNRSLDKAFIEQKVKVENTKLEVEAKSLQAQNIQEESVKNQTAKETVLNLNVPQNVVETIQSKIIGAHQRVGGFMSEVARNMYLNYKPPFTSFRLNLNPANLGSISIIMRANKNDNNLSVSMNMSNSNTMESFVENKQALQNALQRQLGESSNITLNFGMENGSDSESFSGNMGEPENRKNSEETIEDRDLDSNENSEEVSNTDKKLDYM